MLKLKVEPFEDPLQELAARRVRSRSLHYALVTSNSLEPWTVDLDAKVARHIMEPEAAEFVANQKIPVQVSRTFHFPKSQLPIGNSRIFDCSNRGFESRVVSSFYDPLYQEDSYPDLFASAELGLFFQWDSTIRIHANH